MLTDHTLPQRKILPVPCQLGLDFNGATDALNALIDNLSIKILKKV